MYLDVVLFVVGGICALLALLSGLYLIISHKKSKTYSAELQEETERINDIFTTISLTDSVKSTHKPGDLSDIVSKKHTVIGETELIIENSKTEITDSQQQETETVDFDSSSLEGKYILRSEIHGGGMSRVFVADSAKIGNRWIVKFVPRQMGELVNEENILKQLYHSALPQIADIFQDDKGIYLVESFIEGISLDKVLDSGQKISVVTIMDWIEQLIKVINYLHRKEPHPIYHFDLKPSNIMVTHDNRLVLIDFGISKRLGTDETTSLAVTYNYAAPEQLKHSIPEKYVPTINNRFGELPADRLYWKPDARTDIYSLGVILFQLATGQLPTSQNSDKLKTVVSHEVYAVISKCLEIDPAARYQTADEMLVDFLKTKDTKMKKARTLLVRKIAAISTAFSVVLTGGSFTGGYYLYEQENAALLEVEPELVIVSLQQSSELIVEKQMPNGDTIVLDNSRIRWSFSQNNIARVDGNRISGINMGETELSGNYRNKAVTLSVRVVEPMDDMVDISQRYRLGHFIHVFAGTTERDHIDGLLDKASFFSPESIAVADNGMIYIVDSGVLRIIRGNQVESINLSPDYITPKTVRCYNNDVYILTDTWQEDESYSYGIIRLTSNGNEVLYIADARYTAIEDFVISQDGLIYFIERNEGIGAVSLKTLNPNNSIDIMTLCELPKGILSLATDERGAVYLANPETGTIQIWHDGSLAYFAGIENERAFIDGTAPLFYMPQNIKYSNGFLFVWDFNVLRRISVMENVAIECITIVGEASPVFEWNIKQSTQMAESIILPNSKLMDFAVLDNFILLTDPKRGFIWHIE